MLLQRIRLKGFLGHRAPADANGDGFVDIDLRSSPLWLIHGPNGGGKSSLWDAVTFALFKRHRGGGRNFLRLIHDAADEAVVELYFELREQQAQQYRILSKISKTERRTKKADEKIKPAKRKEDGAKTWNIVERWVGDNWESVPGTTGKAEDWVQRRLGMSYETFVCAVLLRQGEADAFIKAEPAKRKERLLELLQLEFYEQLGQKANENKGRWKGQYDALAEALARLPQPTEVEVEAQRLLIGVSEEKSARAVAALEEKERALASARQAEALLTQIESVRERQRADESLLERAAAIEADASLYRELKDVTRVLANLWEARRILDAESHALEASAAKVAEMEERSDALAKSLEQSRADAEKADGVLRRASARLEQVTEQHRAATRQAEELERIELIEREMRDAEEGLKPYLPTLRWRERIEQDYERHTELSEGLRLLKALADALGRLEAARGRLADTQAELSRREEEARRSSEEEERLRRAAEDLSSGCEELQTELNSRALELTRLRDKLEARNEASGKDECPTCGTTLNEKAKGRIEHERGHWAAEAAAAEEEVSRLKRLLAEKKQALERARSEQSSAAAAASASGLAVALARNDSVHADGAVARAESEVEDARTAAGEWAGQLAQLSELVEEFDGLAGALEEWRNLLEAQRVETRVRSALEAHRKQMARLPQWSADERERVKAATEQCEQAVSDCEREETTAEAVLGAARAATTEIETEQARLDGEWRSERGRAADLSRRKAEAQAKYDSKRGELPPHYADHRACEDEAALAELNRRLSVLRGAEEEESKLREARSRQKELETTLEDVGAQLDSIPSEHRRPADEVESERDAAKADVRRAGEELQSAKEKLVKLEEQKRVADEQREEFRKAEEEYSYFRRLAEAFGPGGLRARVVQSAQEIISGHANTILGRLSNGEWRVELRDLSEHELEIQARNVTQAGAQARPFEYLSGGEKFRVAVSLAVAIGQSVLGDRRVDTLVIDEGFGSLDANNRDLMADEMRTLSEKVLLGGRVVIVSHLDDVRDFFGSRYRISKDAAGCVRVERGG